MTVDGWKRLWLGLAGLSGAMAVAFGAYAAHAQQASAAVHLVDTASRYQFYHALALLALVPLQAPGRRLLVAAGLLFVLGTLLFCGGLYLRGLAGVSLGPLVPVGGTSFLLGWLALLASALRHPSAGV